MSPRLRGRRRAKRIGVEPLAITLRTMKRTWARCSSAEHMTFDTDLLREPATFRREVIIHELLHLKVPNHGPVFRRLLDEYLSEETRIV